MSWNLQIERKAQKALKKIPNPYKANLIQAIDQLSDNPRPDGCKKLKGNDNLWRIRINDYRIVYQIRDEQLLILVILIGHRKDIYEGL
ncbi:MAG: type II toxin-antitoxin system RelE/ParE family toxin [Balneolaceae bacterium]